MKEKSYKRVLDSIAEVEHQQWEYWSKSLWSELRYIRKDLDNAVFDANEAIRRINYIRQRWKKNWKPFSKLSRDAKEKYSEWAEKVIPLVPIRCPVHQCGGFMQCKKRKKPKIKRRGYGTNNEGAI